LPEKKLRLFWDWDNTLVFTRNCKTDTDKRSADFTMEFQRMELCTNVKDGVGELLDLLSEFADNILFTASPKEYVTEQVQKAGLSDKFAKVLSADDLVMWLDESNLTPDQKEKMASDDDMRQYYERLYGQRVKDISKFGDLKRSVLIDNEKANGAINPHNTIIAPYFSTEGFCMISPVEEERFRDLLFSLKDCQDITACDLTY